MQRASPTVSIIVNGSPVPLNEAPVVNPSVTSLVTPVVTPEHREQQPQTTTPGVPHVVRVSVGIPSAPEPDERSSSGASSGTGSDDEAPYDSDSGAEMKFHLRELEDTRDDEDGSSGKTSLEGPVLDAELAILSRQGTPGGPRSAHHVINRSTAWSVVWIHLYGIVRGLCWDLYEVRTIKLRADS
ncbi:hypothetical protein HPB47_020766 [Ixodes persulcatus]|uniref:Uncharacterized protein n=1 Tax=Ixodes persulcatus TaxID=34615 RepID=A0AC60QHS6_IXOPE|nr:hypothetical protein HPB47_020766 [Ixodes persulcatus]